MSTTLSHAALAINAVLFDGIWEGVMIGGLVWLGLRCLPRLGSASRYVIWLSALAALVAIPVFTALISGQLGLKAASIATEFRQLIPTDGASHPVPAPRSQSQPIARGADTLLPPEQAAAAPRWRQIMIPPAFVLAIALLWALVALGRMIRLVMDLREITAIRREGHVWSEAYDFPVYVSKRVRVPIAIGFLQPAVILPSTIFEQVDRRALEAILIHEIAHLRRYDVWTNAFARVIEAFIALNPVSWFVARHISTERELACDDWVVARSDSSEAFVRALTAMASAAQSRTLVAAPSALGSQRAIIRRIEQLLDDARPRSLRFSTAALGGTLMLFTLFALTLQAISPVLAFAPPPIRPALYPATVALGCTQPDRGPVLRHTYGPGGPLMGSESLPPDVLQKFVANNPATTTTYEVSVDASGHPHNLAILHRSNDPALDQLVAHSVRDSTFNPAHHNCVAVAATFSSGWTRLPAPRVFTNAIRLPPNNHGGINGKPRNGQCTVPNRNPSIVHRVQPEFPDWIKKLATQRTFMNTVSVRVNEAGSVTSAAVNNGIGQMADDALKVFNDATLVAIKRSTYSPGMANCAPLASEYLVRSGLLEWLEP